MNRANMPDKLVNSLIKQKGSGEVRRVIRDDGENGLYISDPEAPANMYPITRDEFRDDWNLYATVEDQLKEEKVLRDPEQPFLDEPESVVEGVNLTSQVRLPGVDSRNGVDMARDEASQLFGALGRDPFFGRTTDTEKPDADAATKLNPADATLTGGPVGGNEEPASTLEEDRADDDGMAPSGAPKAKADKSPAKTTKTGASKA